MRTLIAALFAVGLAACGSAPTPASSPNIILILTDDQGYGDVGLHGNDQIRTPTLDRFAADGVELTRFYVEPVCAPTRAALMTGRYHYRTGVIHTSRGGAKMHSDETTLAEMLRDAGYRTGLFGKWHLGDNHPMQPTDQGFEEALWHKSGGIGQTPDRPNSYFDPQLWRDGESVESQGYCTDVFFEAAMDFITRSQDEPFFVYLPTNAPHVPLEVPDSYWKPYADAGLDETTARVYGMVENIDDNMERLLAHLDRLQLRDDTIVVFLSDNGPQHERHNAGLRGRKTSTYEGGIRALSYWQWPSALEGTRRLDALGANIDVAPTLLEWAGIDAPPGVSFDGMSLAPVFAGDEPGDRTHFSQVHRGLTPQPYQNAAVITQRHKLVLGPGSFNDESWSYTGDAPAELYDLASDPGESQDLSDENPELTQELLARYDDWFADVRSSRDFTPGVIHVGQGEDPTLLCRYQDSTYVDGTPNGWSVDVLRAGRYEVSVNTADGFAAESLHVSIDGEERAYPLQDETATIELPAGPTQLDIWVQEQGRPRQIVRDNSTLGDVTLRAAD